MPRKPPRLGSRLRTSVERLLLLMLAVSAMQTWYVQGLVGSCPVAGGSMAETLLGVHRDVTCRDCGHRFVCGADLQPVDAQAVCPNCGHAANDLQSRPDVAGDRLLIAKSIYLFRRPRRWEVIAFRHPVQASEVCVKRVVGLPGESIQILDGDVYADGQIVRKTLPQQRALAVLLHDADHRPTIDPTPPPRWQAGQDSRWIAAGGRFTHAEVSDETADETADEDWLEYCHWYRVPGDSGEVREGPVTDLCGYNQTRPRRHEDVHPTADLLLSLRLAKVSGQGRLVLRATDGGQEFRVRIDPTQGRYDVLRDGRPLAAAAGELPSPDDGITVEVSLVDRQFLLAFDGRVAVAAPCDPSRPPPPPISRPLAIAVQNGLGIEICNVRVYRDVYYTHPIGLRSRWALDEPVHLAADEYFVLGDNSPISEDSRTWTHGPAVRAKFLLGKPLVVHFPARALRIGGWEFQVPDLGRIRYIR